MSPISSATARISSEGSPLRRAGAIKAPVLLAHGDLDHNVGVAHSRKMESALEEPASQVELLRFKALDHQLDDGQRATPVLQQDRRLLERTIGR